MALPRQRHHPGSRTGGPEILYIKSIAWCMSSDHHRCDLMIGCINADNAIGGMLDQDMNHRNKLK
jgi:hypothetical protein